MPITIPTTRQPPFTMKPTPDSTPPRLDTGTDWERCHGHDLMTYIHDNNYRPAILEDIVRWHAEMERDLGKEEADANLAITLAHFIEFYQSTPTTITINWKARYADCHSND